MRFICLKIFMGQFFRIKYPYAREFKVVQNNQIPSLVKFRNLYELLHSQVYHNCLKL